MTGNRSDAKQEYRPQVKLVHGNADGENETVAIPDDAIAVSVSHDADTFLLRGDGGRFVVEYLEPVDR